VQSSIIFFSLSAQLLTSHHQQASINTQAQHNSLIFNYKRAACLTGSIGNLTVPLCLYNERWCSIVGWCDV